MADRSFDHDADRGGGIVERSFKSAEKARARANCAILYTDNALMKHCPCSTPIGVARPVSLFAFSLSFPLRSVRFSFFISCPRSGMRK